MPKLLRAGDAALPQRRAAHRPPEGLLGRRRRRALPPAHGPARAEPDGLRRVRPARREPRDQDRPAPARVDRRRRSPSFQQQFREWGISIDWSREFGTHEPRYYRWTQWIFLQLYERGLAYRKDAAVKWCPNDADGAGQRAGHRRPLRALRRTRSRSRQLEQWFFRITDYADRLLDDLDTIEWPEHVKTMQRNWIGRSEGAEVTFRCEELGIDYPVFTTRPDTLFGATFFVMAPEHPDIERLAAGTGNEEAVRAYVNRSLNESVEERGDADKPKTGVALGPHGHQPGQRRADPDVRRRLRAHGVRHRRAHGGARRTTSATTTSRRRSTCRSGGWSRPGGRRRAAATSSDGAAESTRDPDFNGLAPPRAATRSSPGWTARATAIRRSSTGCATGCSRASATGAARSRSSTATRAGWCRSPKTDLPVVLPDVEDYAPKGTSPLAAAEDWVNVACPSCGGPARRETDTMDTFVDSSWYFLRYCDAHNDEAAWDPRGRRVDARRPVHRRRRARDPAPAVRALLRQGAEGPRPPGLRRAVRAPLHPGDDHQGRGEDVQVARQRRVAAASSSSRTGRTRRAATSCSSARPTRTPTGPTRASRACTASSAGCGGCRPPRRPTSGGRRARAAGATARLRRGAGAQGALGDREGHQRHGAGASRSTPRSPR